MNNQAPAFIRTAVPFLVGLLVTYLTSKGFEVSPEDAAMLGSGLTVVAGYLYYLIVRLLEQRNPQLGVLLGVAKQPVYKETKNG